MTKAVSRSLVALGLLVLLCTFSDAQDQPKVLNSHPASRVTVPPQVMSLLSSLPDADALVYLNPQRILNEAAPKVVPENDLAKMRQQFAEMKQQAGVDPSKLDFVVLAMRFRKPSSDLSFQAPEFLVVGSGDFSAESLMTLMRLGLQDKLREEKYGSKTVALTTIEDLAKEAEKNPFLRSLAEIAVVSLNGNTLAAGNVSYVKAAIDAADGRERINQETLNSLMRDQSALVSIAGSPWNSFARGFGLLGTDANPRTPRCDLHLGDFYAAVTMDATNFKLRGAMNADNPDTARIINNLATGLMKTFVDNPGDVKSFPSILRMMNLTAKDNEVVVQADFPQQVVMDLIREQMKPPPPPTVDEVKPAARATPAKKPRRTTRKHRSKG